MKLFVKINGKRVDGWTYLMHLETTEAPFGSLTVRYSDKDAKVFTNTKTYLSLLYLEDENGNRLFGGPITRKNFTINKTEGIMTELYAEDFSVYLRNTKFGREIHSGEVKKKAFDGSSVSEIIQKAIKRAGLKPGDIKFMIQPTYTDTEDSIRSCYDVIEKNVNSVNHSFFVDPYGKVHIFPYVLEGTSYKIYSEQCTDIVYSTSAEFFKNHVILHFKNYGQTTRENVSIAQDTVEVKDDSSIAKYGDRLAIFYLPFSLKRGDAEQIAQEKLRVLLRRKVFSIELTTPQILPKLRPFKLIEFIDERYDFASGRYIVQEIKRTVSKRFGILTTVKAIFQEAWKLEEGEQRAGALSEEDSLENIAEELDIPVEAVEEEFG